MSPTTSHPKKSSDIESTTTLISLMISSLKQSKPSTEEALPSKADEFFPQIIDALLKNESNEH